jgi:hypothetical protein
MSGAVLYLVSLIDLIPEAILGPLGLVLLFVYELVKVRRILAEGGIELGRQPDPPVSKWIVGQPSQTEPTRWRR